MNLPPRSYLSDSGVIVSNHGFQVRGGLYELSRAWQSKEEQAWGPHARRKKCEELAAETRRAYRSFAFRVFSVPGDWEICSRTPIEQSFAAAKKRLKRGCSSTLEQKA